MPAQNGHLEVVKLLLDKGADVDKADEVNQALNSMPEPPQRHTIVRACVCVGVCVYVCLRVRVCVLYSGCFKRQVFAAALITMTGRESIPGHTTRAPTECKLILPPGWQASSAEPPVGKHPPWARQRERARERKG